jgi:hypothetical protein
VGYRRFSLYLDRLRLYPIKQLASSEGWEAGDLTRVLIVLALREAFQDMEHLAKRSRHAGFVSHMLRPLKAQVANSEVMDPRLPEGFAAIVEIYARKTAASRNQALAELILAATKAHCEAELSFHKTLKASRAEQEQKRGQNSARTAHSFIIHGPGAGSSQG